MPLFEKVGGHRKMSCSFSLRSARPVMLPHQTVNMLFQWKNTQAFTLHNISSTWSQLYFPFSKLLQCWKEA